MLFKIFYSDRTEIGLTREDFDRFPDVDVQLLLVKLDPELAGKSRVGFYQERQGLWGDCAFYLWGADDHPTGVTPDAVLDRWAQWCGDTSVTIADLSLDNLKSIGVKIGRSVDTPVFEQIVRNAINDPDIP